MVNRLILSLFIVSGMLWLIVPVGRAQPDTCPGNLPPRLVINEQAQVTPGAPNRVRAEPTTSGAQVGEIPGGGVFYVLAGPECADGFTWWQVDYEGLIGWTVEGREDYWLVPLVPTSAETVEGDLPVEAATQSAPPPPSSFRPDGVCQQNLPPQLVVGWQAQLIPGLPNRIRALPSTSGEQVGEIPGDGIFYVLSGPVCSEGFTWWRVLYQGVKGWTVEGVDDYHAFALQPENLTPWTSFRLPNQTSYRGVSFNFPHDVASRVSWDTIPASEDELMGITEPEHIAFSFEQYPVEASGFRFNIYPLADYEEGVTSLSDLRALLDERPRSVGYIASPPINAATIIGVQSTYVDFQNGSGVRSLVHWAQSPDWVATLNYVYMGLTDDGESVVIAVFPLGNLPVIPGEQRFQLDYEAFLDVYSEYITLVSDTFQMAPARAFRPDLNHLDAMIASLRVEVRPETVAEIARPTLTPFPTATPSPTATPLPECTLIAFNDTNLRSVPDAQADRNGQVMGAGREYIGEAQYQRRGENFPWWRIRSRDNFIRGWVRADFVEEIGDCDALPVEDYTP